ncbi:MAG TPA: palindromic element RPE4 domain-containing protein [Rickettsia endosymbiont of Ceroptres masudai]|nr:palindromic element RPE4 domain-containing protein [Rickettsia endosymbiont of Ceroptres masudai]
MVKWLSPRGLTTGSSEKMDTVVKPRYDIECVFLAIQ